PMNSWSRTFDAGTSTLGYENFLPEASLPVTSVNGEAAGRSSSCSCSFPPWVFSSRDCFLTGPLPRCPPFACGEHIIPRNQGRSARAWQRGGGGRKLGPGDSPAGGRGGWGPGGPPADFEEFLRRGQDRLRGLMPGNLGGRGFALLALAAVVLWAFSGFFRVEP